MTVIYWCGFGLIHSLLASTFIREEALRYLSAGHYRLLYNLIALLSLLPGLSMIAADTGAVLFAWPDWLFEALMLGGGLIIVIASRAYDLGAFLGLSPDASPFRVVGIHRFIRHPWYLGGLLILWAQAMTPRVLETQIALTVYLLIGIYFEERKLARLLGEPYNDYRHQVPMLIPSLGRHLSRSDAQRLEERLNRVHPSPNVG